MNYFRDKVVWITGASSGIGEAFTYELARQGAKLILSSRRKEELERVKGNCMPTAHTMIRVLPLDLAEANTLELTTKAAIQLFGHIDVLINNGGISQRSLAKDTTLAVDRRIMEVDYFGTIALTKYLLPHFYARQSGHVATISSVMGIIGTPYRSGYAAAKHALHGYFDSLRAEVWKDCPTIYFTLICPGWIRTNLTFNALIGDGRALNEMDATTDAGLAPAELAVRALRAIAHKKEEVYIGGPKEVFGVYLKRFLPGLFSRIVRKAVVR
jgi:short-subunit dehydrogenase